MSLIQGFLQRRQGVCVLEIPDSARVELAMGPRGGPGQGMDVLSYGCTEIRMYWTVDVLKLPAQPKGHCCVWQTHWRDISRHQCMDSSFQPRQGGGVLWLWPKLNGDFSVVQEYLSVLQWNLVALLWIRCSSCKGLCWPCTEVVGIFKLKAFSYYLIWWLPACRWRIIESI